MCVSPAAQAQSNALGMLNGYGASAFEGDALIPCVISSIVAYSVYMGLFGFSHVFAIPELRFTDVRELQSALRADGIKMVVEADESGAGPASFCILDPDGNPILVDQHR